MDRENIYKEKELLLRIAEGEEPAYRLLFDRYWLRLYELCLKMTKSPEQAKDLTQEVFEKLWAHRRSLAEVQHFEAFLVTIARNLVRNFLKKRVFQPENDGYMLAYLTQEPDMPDEYLEGRELHAAVASAIKKLPPQLQRVFLLKFQGFSHDEIAGKLGISKATSKTYVVRALELLRKYLAQYPDALLLCLIFIF